MQIMIPNRIAGLMMVRKLIPVALMAFISLSSLILPKVMSVAMRTAMGTASETIHARLKKRYSKMIGRSIPFPKKRSTALNRKFVNKIKIMMSREKQNGKKSSFRMYLFSRRMAEITVEFDLIFSGVLVCF
jgi:hypothetical protein